MLLCHDIMVLAFDVGLHFVAACTACCIVEVLFILLTLLNACLDVGYDISLFMVFGF